MTGKGYIIPVKEKLALLEKVQVRIDSGKNISRACKGIMPRRTYYKYIDAKEKGQLKDQRMKGVSAFEKDILLYIVKHNPKGSIDDYLWGANQFEVISLTRYKVWSWLNENNLNKRGEREHISWDDTRKELLEIKYEDFIGSSILPQMLIPRDKATKKFKRIRVKHKEFDLLHPIITKTNNKENIKLKESLKVLTKQEKTIYTKYFGLNNEQMNTFEELERSLNLSEDKIRKIIKQAIKKMNKMT